MEMVFEGGSLPPAGGLPDMERRILTLFEDLDADIAAFKSAAGIGCPTGCGHCCENPDIEATAVEFFPLALELWRRGDAVPWLEAAERGIGDACIFYVPIVSAGSTGHCSVYPYRGYICRLFGFCARINKYGIGEWVGCRPIKETDPACSGRIQELIRHGCRLPILQHYHQRLVDIDPVWSQKRFPINEAVVRAIERTGFLLQWCGTEPDSRAAPEKAA